MRVWPRVEMRLAALAFAAEFYGPFAPHQLAEGGLGKGACSGLAGPCAYQVDGIDDRGIDLVELDLCSGVGEQDVVAEHPAQRQLEIGVDAHIIFFVAAVLDQSLLFQVTHRCVPA